MGGDDLNNARALTAAGDIAPQDGRFRSQRDVGWVNDEWGSGRLRRANVPTRQATGQIDSHPLVKITPHSIKVTHA